MGKGIAMEYGCKGKIVVLSGGTSGIGLAAAKRFREDGAMVFLLGRSTDRGMAALQELPGGAPAAEQERPGALFVRCDVRDPEACRFAAAVIQAYAPQVDILVNCAGGYREASLEDTTPELYGDIMDTNVKGAFFLTQACRPLMHDGSCIVNISSDAGIAGNTGCAAYCASKGALVALTKALALDLAPQIRVNCVCPGDVDTPLLDRQIEAAGGSYTKDDLARAYPLARIATADEVAHVIASVASPANSFMTGAVIPVDGGITAQG